MTRYLIGNSKRKTTKEKGKIKNSKGVNLMNTPFYIWTAIFTASFICLAFLLIDTIHMRQFYKMMGNHIKREKEKSDRLINDDVEIELVEYTDAECGREK